MNNPAEPIDPKAASEDIQVGSFFLETLTTGMYENPLDCVREYVQNGFDAIQDSIRADEIAEDDGRIEISIAGSVRAPALVIKDNGSGIPSSEAYSTLVSLGASRKIPSRHSGFRGIGRLAGIAYCTTLRFTTKSSDETVETVVEFDCGRIRGYFSPGGEPVDVRDVVRSSVKTWTNEADATAHYTKVEMLQLVNLGTEFTEFEKLQAYLRQVCPVEYSDNFDFADRVHNLASSFGEKLGVTRVNLRKKKERLAVHKPYRNSYPTAKKNTFSKLNNIEIFSSKEHGWFGWIGVSNFPGEIVDETVSGVRFRMKNIQIGNSEIIENLAEELTLAGSDRRLQPWAVGEIFITNMQVVPNARRDGFEDSKAWRAVRQEIKAQVVRRIVKLVRGASTTRTALKTLSNALNSLSTNLSDPELTLEGKIKIERDIARHLEKLGSPDKLLAADPKEVSKLNSEFKELQERLEKTEIAEVCLPEPDEEGSDTGTESDANVDGPTENNESGANAATETPPENAKQEESPFSLMSKILRAELDNDTATRLIDLIDAELKRSGLMDT